MLKDILLHVDHTPASPGRIDAAVRLAQRYNARITGLFMTAQPHYGHKREHQGLKGEATRDTFLKAVSEANVSGHWKTVDLVHSALGAVETINHHACFADLVVTGQFQPGSGDRDIPENFSERVVLGSGRPVLVIPYVGASGQMGERIMVAWKPGPKSTRALHDALPLLQTAQSVHLFSVASSGDFSSEGDQLREHLKRHGVLVKISQVPPGDLSTSDIFLNMVVDEGIDLVVMGAHAQLRRGNLDLGIVGKTFLQHMTVPVLMSH